MSEDTKPRMTSVEVAPGRHLLAAAFGDPASERMVLFDPGSFGCYVDGLYLCWELAGRGWHAITYSRAGMHGSDPVPDGETPDPRFHVADMVRLLDKLEIAGPIVLAGHSMAGVRLHYAGEAIPERLRGLAFLDAVCPSLTRTFTWGGWTSAATAVARAGVSAAGTAIAPFIEQFHPNVLKLEGEHREAKLKSIASPEHLKAAAAEITAMDRKTRGCEIEEALDVPALFVSATPVSQGTSKLCQNYAERGTWFRRIQLPNDGHMSMLTPPGSEAIADGIEELWAVAGTSARAPAEPARP